MFVLQKLKLLKFEDDRQLGVIRFFKNEFWKLHPNFWKRKSFFGTQRKFCQREIFLEIDFQLLVGVNFFSLRREEVYHENDPQLPVVKFHALLGGDEVAAEQNVEFDNRLLGVISLTTATVDLPKIDVKECFYL